jgi:hypothetical protein
VYPALQKILEAIGGGWAVAGGFLGSLAGFVVGQDVDCSDGTFHVECPAGTTGTISKAGTWVPDAIVAMELGAAIAFCGALGAFVGFLVAQAVRHMDNA